MGVADFVKGHQSVMLDTAPVIYFIEENHQELGQVAADLFAALRADSRVSVFTSVITLIEVLTKPIKMGRPDLVDQYRQFLSDASNLELHPVDTVIAEKSVQLRAKYGLRTPDAIQAAVAIENRASLPVTNDKGFRAVREFEVLLLQDFV